MPFIADIAPVRAGIVADNVTLTLTLPVHAPLADVVAAVEAATVRRVTTGDSIAAGALVMLLTLCERGHQALLADHTVARDQFDRDAARDALLAQIRETN